MNVKALISCQKFVLSEDVLGPETVDAMHGGETTVPRKRLGSRRTEQTSLVTFGETPPADRLFLLVDEDLQGQKNPIEVPARTPPGPIDE